MKKLRISRDWRKHLEEGGLDESDLQNKRERKKSQPRPKVSKKFRKQ